MPLVKSENDSRAKCVICESEIRKFSIRFWIDFVFSTPRGIAKNKPRNSGLNLARKDYNTKIQTDGTEETSYRTKRN
jgi:hypothetical protein